MPSILWYEVKREREREGEWKKKREIFFLSCEQYGIQKASFHM